MSRFEDIEVWGNSSIPNSGVLVSGEFYDDGAIEVGSVKINGIEIIGFLNFGGEAYMAKEVSHKLLGKPVCEDSTIKLMLMDNGVLTICEQDFDSYNSENNNRILDKYPKEMTMKLYEDLKAVFERGEK